MGILGGRGGARAIINPSKPFLTIRRNTTSIAPSTSFPRRLRRDSTANESHIISFEPPNIIYTESNYTKKAYIKVMQLTSFSGKLPSFKCGTTIKKNDSDRVIEYDTISQPNNSVQIFMLVTVLSIAFGRIYTCRQRNYAELKMKHKKILNRRTKHKARKGRKRNLCYQTFGMKNFSKHKRCSSSGNLFPVNCSSDDEYNDIQEVNEKCSHQEPLVNINGGGNSKNTRRASMGDCRNETREEADRSRTFKFAKV